MTGFEVSTEVALVGGKEYFVFEVQLFGKKVLNGFRNLLVFVDEADKDSRH